jgi:hypothetical protein
MSKIERHIRQARRALLGANVRVFTNNQDVKAVIAKRNRLLTERRHVIDMANSESGCNCEICQKWVGLDWIRTND